MVTLFSTLYLGVCLVYTLVSLLLLGIMAPFEGLLLKITGRLKIQDFILENQHMFMILGYVLIFSTGFISTDTTMGIVWHVFTGICGLAVFFTAIFDINQLPFKHPDRLNFIERWFRDRMINPLDVFHVQQMMRVSLAIVPIFLSFLIPEYLNWFAILMFFRARYRNFTAIENLLHQEMHTFYFRTKKSSTRFEKMVFGGSSLYLNYVLGPLLGYPAHFYTVHHMFNHHRENNGLDDITTLVHRDRSSFFDFCRTSFLFFWSWSTGFDLIRYLYKRKSFKQIRLLLFGLVLYYGIIATLCYVNPYAGLVFLLGQLCTGVGLGVQLWFWHGLQNILEPGNVYQNSVNVLLPVYTNDSYHIEHHKRGNVHWSKYPENVVKDIPKYIREKSICLRGIESREQVLFMLWLKRFDLLATHVINFGKQPLPKQDIIALLMERVRPLEPQTHGKLYLSMERGFVNLIHLVLGGRLKSGHVNYDKDHVEGWSENVEKFFPHTEPFQPFPLTREYAGSGA